MEKKPLSAKEAAKEVGVHPDTMRRALRDGTVRGEKVRNGPWLVPVAEVERLTGSRGDEE